MFIFFTVLESAMVALSTVFELCTHVLIKSRTVMANDPQGSAKRHADVVTRVFPQAVSLFDYCSAVIDFQGSEKLIMPADPVSYSNLLSDTLILPPAATTKYIVTKVSKYPIRDTIGRLVSQCVRSNPSYHEQNCLALGYRSKTSNCDATMRTSNDTELYFVNTIQAIVTTQTWQLFANRVGKNCSVRKLTSAIRLTALPYAWCR
jgi:sorbitol-specific phosphotransferase system component IIC